VGDFGVTGEELVGVGPSVIGRGDDGLEVVDVEVIEGPRV
jgi:hypothetical protein